jgi:sulfur-oxidizing protein SoxY
MKRRHFLAGVGAAVLLPRAALAESSAVDALVRAATRGAPARKERVRLELPVLADNGNSVAMKVSVDSPMSAADHVKSIRLLSEKNPVQTMAVFYLGPRAGRAQIASRVRLAGSQSVVAVAEMSDGSFWFDVANVIVTLSACVDES